MQLLQKAAIYEKGIKKVALQKKQVMRNIPFLKKQLFPKSGSFKKVDTVQKESASEKQLFCRYLLLVAVPKSSCTKEFPIIKIWFLGRNLAMKKQLFRKKIPEKK